MSKSVNRTALRGNANNHQEGKIIQCHWVVREGQVNCMPGFKENGDGDKNEEKTTVFRIFFYDVLGDEREGPLHQVKGTHVMGTVPSCICVPHVYTGYLYTVQVVQVCIIYMCV